MKIINSEEKIPNLSVALGFFDGVHIAHQKVIKSAVDFAKNNNTKSAVITFRQQPYCVLKKIKPIYISSRPDSYEIIKKLGVDYIIELDFDKICNLTAEDYLENILIKRFSPCGIFTGFNHHFGINRTGNPDFLYKNQEKYGYKYFSIPALKYNNQIVSSSAIRNFIKNSDIINANLMLGREFSLKGTVIKGNQIGRTINFPTANMVYPENIITPKNGVYLVTAELNDGRLFDGIANFGIKPTISNNGSILLETHILNGFNEDIYGQVIKILFKKFIRPEQKFKNLDELKEQIKRDISSC